MRAGSAVSAIATCAVLTGCGSGETSSPTTGEGRLSARFTERTIYESGNTASAERVRGAFDWTARKGWAVETRPSAKEATVQVGNTCYRRLGAGRWKRSPARDVEGLCDAALFGDPARAVELLRQVAFEWARVGERRLRGVSTVHYRARLDVGAVKGRFDVWVDDAGRARRIEQRPDGGRFVEVRDYFDFGADVEVRPPSRATEGPEYELGAEA